MTSDGHFVILGMLFASAPSEFQRLMSLILGDYINTIVQVYIDDIIISANNFEKSLERFNDFR